MKTGKLNWTPFAKLARKAMYLLAFAVFGAQAATVAKVGDAEYETLATAVSAVKTGETIVLQQSVAEKDIYFAWKSFTLDLNGFSAEDASSSNRTTFYVNNGAELVVVDRSAGGGGTTSVSLINSAKGLTIGESASVNGNNLTIAKNVSAVKDSVVTVYGGVFKGGISSGGSASEYTLKIFGGRFAALPKYAAVEYPAGQTLVKGEDGYVLGEAPLTYDLDAASVEISLGNGKTYTVKQTSADTKNTVRATVPSGVEATLVLDGIKNTGAAIVLNVAEGATLWVELDGENVVGSTSCSSTAPFRKIGAGLLVIQDENGVLGSLTATAGQNAAAIGGSYKESVSNIEIKSGTITATSGQNGAAIGAGGSSYDSSTRGYVGGEASNITVSGGTLTLTGGQNGAVIGAGSNGSAANITVSGGTLTLKGGKSPLGAPSTSKNTNVTVTGGTFATANVTAVKSFLAEGVTIDETTGTVVQLCNNEKSLRKAFYEAPTDGTTVTITLGADITLETLYAAENFGTETLADNAEGDTFNRYKIGVHPTAENPSQWNSLVTDQTQEARLLYGAYYHTSAGDERIARLVVKAGQKIVLDLNGHTIQKNALATHGDWSNVCTDIIGNYGTLEIVDSSTGTKGTVKGIGYNSCNGAVLHNYEGAMMTVKGVNVDGNATGMAKGTGQYVIANDGGTLTIDGANVFDTATTADASLVVNTAGTVTIIGNATLNHPTTKAVNVKGGVVTVESATIISDKYAIYAKGGEVNVNDLKVTGTGTLAMEGNTATITKKPGVDLPAPVGFTWVENDGKLVLKSFAAKIGETEYETLDAAITAVQDGGTIVVNAGDYKLNGSLSYAGKAFTIQSAEGAKVSFDMSAAVALHGAKITFTGVTFDYKTNNDYIGLQHADTLVYNDCTINGKVFLYAASETFNHCTFSQTAEDYNVWTYGAKAVTFNDCTFKNAGKTVNAYIEAGNASSEPQKIELKDCKVESSKSNKAVLNIKNKTQAYEVVLSGKNEVTGIDVNETTKSAWYQVETADSTDTTCKAVTVKETADDGTSTVVYEVKPYVAAYVTVTGIAGFADKKYASFADAYVAIKPTLEQYGLVEESVSAETFKSLFTDIDDNGNATLTYTISGTVVYDESNCANLLTMGRKASHYSNGHLINFKFVGATGKESDTLTVNSDITLPYEWWGEKTTTGIHFENLTITGSAPSGLYPSQKFFEGIDFSVVKCVLKGIKIYNCSNVGGSYTITDSVLDGTGAPADSYAIHLQGNETAPLSITIKGNTISGYDRGINIDQRTAVAIIEKNSISVKDKGRSCIQLTRLAKTTVSGNTLDLTGGNAITFHEGLLGLSAVPEVSISGNAVTGTGYLIYDDAAANNKAFTSDNLKLTYTTDNTVAETVDTTQGVKGSTVSATSTAVNNEIQHYAATIGTQGYATLEAALAEVAEGKPLTWVSETAWPTETPVYYNGKFYKPETVNSAKKGALERAIDAANTANADEVAKIYVRPGFDANELVLQAHQPMKTSLAIYGNDAKLSRNWEPCVEYPGTDYHTLTKDVSIEIYNLHDGAGIWGQRLTAFTVTVTMADCRNAHEVLLNGQYETAAASVNNFTIRRCTFDGSKAAAVCPVTTTSAGKVVVEDCTFANLNTDYVVNMNNKNGGTTEVSVKSCSFTSCGKEGKEVVRLTGEAEGSEVVAELDNLTFDETSKANAIIVGNKKTANNNASVRYTISKTTGTLNVYKQGATTAETTELLASAEQPYAGSNVAEKVVDFATFVAALEAANYTFDGSTHTLAQDGRLTVKWSPKSGCYDTREGHNCTVGNVPATANTPKRVNSGLTQFQLFEGGNYAVSVKNVAFVYEPAAFTVCENSDWKGSFTAEQAPAGQIFLMNTGDVAFEGCTFDKVVLTSFNCTGTSTVKDCSFKDVYNSYAVKDIRGAKVSVTGCTFENCGAAIMVSSTVKVDAVTIRGNTFKNVDVAGTAAEGKAGTRGLVQIAASGDYSETAFDFSGNTATDCGPVMRQLNTTVSFDTDDKTALSKLVSEGGALYTDDTFVAQVGEAKYATLAEAFAALTAENHTLTLLEKKDAFWDAAKPVYWSAGAQSGYAATLKAALTAAYKANEGAITVVCRPGADVGEMTHGHVADDLTIYGNNAYISDGECDLEVDTFKFSRATGAQANDGVTLDKDITITAYELDNLGVWGQRTTAHKVTVNLTDCDGKALEGKTNVQRVYISGKTGVNDITLTDCDFITKATAVYSNADGAIKAVNCSFTGGQVPFNINHKADGAQTVTIESCTFTKCGDVGEWKQFAAPIRFVNSGAGTLSASVSKTTIMETVGANGDILLGDGRTGQKSNDVSLKVVDTAANIQAQKPGYYNGEAQDETKKAATTAPAEGTLETSVAKLLPVDPRTLGYATSGTAEALPAAPDMSGEVVDVTAAQAQYVLDGAYGSIDGKTINFTESIDATLVLGRASKYDGSQTVYRHGSHDGESMPYADYIAYKNQSSWTEGGYYERTVQNVTFTASEGMTVKGFTAEGGAHIYGTEEAPCYDYVRDTGVWCKDNSGFYKRAILKNITFKGLTFTAKVDLSTSEATTVYDGLTFTGCTFDLGTTASGNQAIRYYNENANDNVKNLVVEGCTFRNCFQGVYTANAKGITVKDSTFDTTGHNAIAVQDAAAFNHGAIVITGNTFKNIGDRIIRFGHVGDGTTITITGNMADGNSGKLDTATGKREIVAATTLPENAADSIKASNNNWGENAVVAGVFTDDYATKLGTEACPYSREQFAAMTRADYIEAQKRLGGTLYVNVGDYSYEKNGVLGNGERNDATGQTPDHSKLNAYGENGYLGEKNDGANGKTVVFVGGTITSGVTGYTSIDNIGTSLLLAVPAYTKVAFKKTTFKNVLSFDYQLYTSPWSQLGDLAFEGCTFDGIIVGAIASQELAFNGCTFNDYKNTASANNSNPTWIRPAYGNWTKGDNEGQGTDFRSLTKITFENNTVTSTRPVKFERIAQWEMATTVTATGNTFDITPQEGDKDEKKTKNVGLYFGANAKFDLVIDENKKNGETAALYTAVYSAPNGTGYAGLPAGSTVRNKAGEDVASEDAFAWKTTDTLTLKTTEEVASVGAVSFATLAEAVAAAADGDTVTLLDDVTLTEALTLDKDLTLDLGGKTVTAGAVTMTRLSNEGCYAGLIVNGSAQVTVKNGTLTSAYTTYKDGTTSASYSSYVVLVDDTAHLTLDDVRVVGQDAGDNYVRASGGICYDSTGSLTLKFCTVSAGASNGKGYNYNNPVAIFTVSGCDGTLVVDATTVTGGAATGTKATDSAGSAALNVNGGVDVTVSNDSKLVGGGSAKTAGNALEARGSGTLKVSDSTLQGGSSTDGTGGSALYVTSATVTAEVTGATLVGGDGGTSWDGSGVALDKAATVTITDSTVKSGRGENATGKAAAIKLADPYLTGGQADLTLSNVRLSGSDKNDVIKNGLADGIKLTGDVTVDAGTLKNVAISELGESVTIKIAEEASAEADTVVSLDPDRALVKDSDVLFRSDAAVAQVVDNLGNKMSYASLASAVAAAADGETVKLLADVTVAEQLVVEKALTLDLGGKTVTSTYVIPATVSPGADRYALLTKAAVTVKNGTFAAGQARALGAYANLTLTDATVTSELTGGHCCVAFCAAGGTYTVANATITGDYAIANFAHNATIAIAGSKLEGSGCGLYHNGSNYGLKLTVTDTTVNGAIDQAIGEDKDPSGVYLSGSLDALANAENQNGANGRHQATFTRCTIKGNTGVEVKYTDLTLEDCTVVATTKDPSYTPNNNGMTALGFAVVSTDNAKGETTPKPEGTITITGANGSYTGLVGLGSLDSVKTNFADFTDADYAVSGGTFSTAIDAAYCASGYIPTKNADGTYGVKEGAYVAQVGTTKYDTLEGAIEAAVAAGQAVELLDDVVVTDFTLNVGVTIRSADETRHEIKGLKAISGTGVTLENVYLNLDQTLDIGGTDTTLKNCVMRAKDVGYDDVAKGGTTGFTGGKPWTDGAGSYLVRVTGTNVALTDCLFDGTDKNEEYFPNMCLAPVSGTDVTMTRCTFNEGWAACYYSTPHGTWTLDGCKFTKIYCYNIQAGDTAANIVVKNCELAGWTSFGSDMASVSFEKCSFAKSSGFATIVAYKDVTFTDCSFTEDYKDSLYIEADMVAELTGCTVVDADGNASTTVSLADLANPEKDTGFAAIDATKNEDGKYTAGRFVGKEDAIRTAIADGYALTVGDDGSYTLDTAVAQIGTKGYASLAEAISAAKSGDTITLLADVVNTDYTVANAVDIKLASGVTLDGNGKTISGNVKVTVASEGGVAIKNANFRDIHNAADVSDAYKTKYGFSDDKVGTLSAIYAPNLAGALTISGCTFENSDWEAMQITPAEGAKIDIRDNVFKTSESDVVKEQLRHVHVEMAYGTGFDYEGTDIELTITDNQFLGETKEANMGVWWVGKTSTLDVTGNYYANPDAVSITLSDKSFKRENRCDLIYPARSVADVDVDDLTAVALVVKDAFNATAHQTFEAAVAAADAGATVKMLANVVLTEQQTIAKVVVLDLNGKAIASTIDEFITISQNGDLTVNDATGEGRIENTATSGSVIKIATGATGGFLTVTGGTILSHSSTDETIYTQTGALGSGAAINVKGGRIENDGKNSSAIKLGSGTGTTLNVTNGEIVGGKYGLYAVANTVINISGGTIIGNTGNAVYSGAYNKITISGGMLTPGGTAAALAIGGGSSATSSCTVTIGREGGVVGDVTIPSIDFKPSFSANEATVNLLSGRVLKFLGWDNMKIESVSQGKDKLLVGTDISKSLPGSDLLCQLDAESGLYEIVKLTVENAVAIVTHDGTETPYRTVEQAVRAVTDGDTLTLKVDHTGSLVLSAKNVTVDLGGNTLTLSDRGGSALSFNQSTASDNTVTVKNGTIVAKGQGAACVSAKMTGDLSKALTVVFGADLTLTSGSDSRYGAVLLHEGARTALPCASMTKGGLLVTEGEKQWIYGETETAFTHAGGAEVTLLNDWTYSDDADGAVKVPETCAYTSAKLNLDGHTIKHYGTGPAIVMSDAAKPDEGTAAKTLEISNGVIETPRHGAAVCGSNKSLTLDGVTLKTTGDNKFGIYANGMTRGNTVTLRKGSAVVSEKATGIYFPGAGTLTVEDSNVTGGVSGIEVRAGVLNVSGTSVIESTAEGFSFKNDDNGITTTGAAVAAVKHTVGNDLAVTITGGTFKGPRGFYANDPNAATGGKVTVSISGGAFSTDVEKDYLADGCKTVQQTIDGVLYYVVGPAVTQIEVSLGDAKKRLPFADAWLADKIGADASGWTTEALEEKDENGNGLAKWQCYLFGLDPNDATAKIVATAKQGTAESIPLTVANADAATSPLVMGGYVTVTYVLMGSNDGTAWTEVVTSDKEEVTSDKPDGLAIPLTGTTYKFYRVDVKVTSAESAEGN